MAHTSGLTISHLTSVAHKTTDNGQAARLTRSVGLHMPLQLALLWERVAPLAARPLAVKSGLGWTHGVTAFDVIMQFLRCAKLLATESDGAVVLPHAHMAGRAWRLRLREREVWGSRRTRGWSAVKR